MIVLGVIVTGSLLGAYAYDRQVQRKEPPSNQSTPPGWNDQWEYRPNSDGNYRWHDPNGGEWRRHDQDRWHPAPHWDYNPWKQWNSPWENRHSGSYRFDTAGLFFQHQLDEVYPNGFTYLA